MIPLLHQPYLPRIRHALRAATPAGARIALDVGCGDGSKTQWLREQCAPDALLIGIDRDVTALRSAPALTAIAGDAAALPLRDGCVDLIWCVAALQLFADRQQALRELWRVLRPGGTLLIATAGEYWARLRCHPPALLAALPPVLPLAPADGLADEWTLLLAGAGFAAPQAQAYLLDGAEPAQAALIDSADLAAYAGLPLTASSITEPDPRPVLFVVSGRK